MNFDGFAALEIPKFSSLVEQDDPTSLPTGISPLAQNVRFHLDSVRTRDGIQNQYGFTLPDNAAVTGLAALKVGGAAGDLQVPIAFSALGDLYIESPVGSGKVKPITGPLVALPSAASMQLAAAFTRGYLAFGDLKNSLGLPAVYTPSTGTLDPLSMLPVGQPWAALTNYYLGECITPAIPVGGNGHIYQCTQAGKSGAAQPPFPAGSGGPLPATAGANGGGIGTAWLNPGNVADTDLVSFATLTTPGTSQSSQAVEASGFGFTIPASATITGVLVTGVAQQAGNGVLSVNIAGGFTPAKQFAPNPGAPIAFSLGGAGDTWGTVLTPTIVNDPGFSANFSALQTPVVTFSLQAVAVTVYFTTVPATVADGSVIWTDVTPTMQSSTLPGNVAFGVRYMVVLFVNENDYISGMSAASVVSATLVDSVHQVQTTIPTGPSNTKARIVAFTPAGQLGALEGTGISSAGPYFWIEPNFPNGDFDLTTIPGGVTVGDVVSGVTMTSTLVNDNTTTSATFNFTDDYLKATLNDVSAYFRKIQVPGCSDIYYSAVQQRMFYASDNLPSGWYVSLEDDPESVYGDNGIVEAAENNGENRTAVRDFLGVTYLMKEKSCYALNANGDDPTQWDAVPQWTGSGPCGPRAVDVATNFMCYIHRSGVWIFEGGQPYRISKEIPITWSQINWSVQESFWIMIDDETREIRIGVAYGQSSVPNLILKCNYEELSEFSPPSFVPPIHFSPYVGKEIATGGCYKWSLDNLSANVCIRAERTLVAPPNGFPLGFDLASIQSQILLGSSNDDGHVDPIIPGLYDDNGQGIDSQIETACPVIVNQAGQVIKSVFGQSRLGGVQLNIGGEGQGGVFVLGLRAKDSKQGGPPLAGKSKANVGSEVRLKKPWIAGIPYSCGGAMMNEAMRIRVTNDCKVGVWFDLKKAVLYAAPVTSARPR